MEKEKLIKEANKARQVAVCLGETIYKYLGDEISKEDLKSKKDTYRNTFVTGFVDDPDNMCYEDDTEDFIINEE